MRKEIYRGDRSEGLALLRRAPTMHMATTDDTGAPVLRTVHGVVVDDVTVAGGGWLAFHGAPAGEKMATLGRAAVLSCEEVVAQIPSYFIDPQRACPATTYYRSAHVHGVLQRLEDMATKGRVLRALMVKLQPEGGHVPIDETDPLYANAVRGILVVGVPLGVLDAKMKLGQNRTPAERVRVLEQLWARGDEGDAQAIDAVRAANADTPVPSFLQAPHGAHLRCALGDDEVDAAVGLVADAYWNPHHTRDALARAHRASTAWVGAVDDDGALIATARAISDDRKAAWIFDVMVRAEWRGRGVGQAVVRLLLDHPRVRRCRRVGLATRDAMGLYAKFGFVLRSALPAGNPEMLLVR